MYVIVVGAGKVGHYLTRTLVSENHEVALIEKQPELMQKSMMVSASSINSS